MTTIDVNKRYDVNPFTKELTIRTKNQKIRISNSSKLNDEAWINNTTGEVATTQLFTYKEVDQTQFIKLFTQNIGLIFSLTGAGIKALAVLVSMLQDKISQDVITLDYEYTLKKFMSENPSLQITKQYFYRGLKELINAEIIAKHKKQGDYFINPNFVWNGDRLLLVNAIKKKSPAQNLEDEQLELDI